MTDHSTLDMGKFTVRGGDGPGILCQGYCFVRSSDSDVGGTITGFTGDGILGSNAVAGQVRVIHLVISNNGGDGVRVDAPAGSVSVGRSQVTGNGGIGVESPQRMRVAKSTIANNAMEGLNGPSVKVTATTIENNAVGIVCPLYLNIDHTDVLDNVGDGVQLGNSLRVFYCHIQGNGGSGIVFSAIGGDSHIQFAEISDNALDGVRVDGPQTERLRMQLAFIRRNGRNGVVANHLLMAECRVDDNALDGIYSPPGGDPCRIGFSQYSLVGNGTDPSCGVSVTCADIATCDPPLNLGPATTCGTSYDTSSGLPGTSWGICSDD
jgi:hypothetical protein